jgi:glutathione synthase/RimK-type ligase-like ATP-grasp enzyme
MSDHIVLVENLKDWRPHFPPLPLITAREYVGTADYLKQQKVSIINLCRSYRYLELGYYCSLLAEARHHKIIPAVRTITDLASKAIYSLNIEDLDSLVQKSLARQPQAAAANRFELYIFFGQCSARELQDLARQLFDLFRCPMLRVEFKKNSHWQLDTLRPLTLNTLTAEQEDLFISALDAYRSRRWQLPRARETARYDLAILYNPADVFTPSNAKALQKFIRIGKQCGLDIDLIKKADYSRLAEYDALFIRETTRIEHHTYRFAKKAESEGMVVIDDPDSILKCCNKVYLAELLTVHKVPTPRTIVVQKGNLKALDGMLDYPMVLKIPNGSFSRGVHKAERPEQLKTLAERLFKESDLILAQEFLYTRFDWRIGILNRRPIYACQYFMSKQHWQVVKHSPTGKFEEGGCRTLPIAEVPPAAVETALAAANLIGDGLYGVDLKETERGIYVIEVNDNPSLDAGVEDLVLGDELYRLILQDFVRRLEAQRIK